MHRLASHAGAARGVPHLDMAEPCCTAEVFPGYCTRQALSAAQGVEFLVGGAGLCAAVEALL